MNRIFLSLLALLVLLFSNNAMATFTKAEIAAVQPLVNELMGDSLRDYKARKISGSQVGDNALKLAKEAESDVAKFICMKGAISYYVRDKAYDKAADTIELMMGKFKDLSPETLSEIVAVATRRVSGKSADRLLEIRKAVNIKIASSKKIRALKAQLAKTPADKRLICRYAELMAIENKWDEALKMFAKMGGDIGKISQDTLNGRASSVQIAEFWWDYKSMEEDAKDAIRLYSLMHYKNAIEKGELVGLKKTLAERRIAECGEKKVQALRNNTTSRGSGLIHRWSFSGDLKDSVGGREGKSINGNILVEKGQVRIGPKGGHVDLGSDIVPSGGEKEYTIEIWAIKYSDKKWSRVFHIPNDLGENEYYISWNRWAGSGPDTWGWKLPGTKHLSASQKGGTGKGIENQFVIVYGHDRNKKPYYRVYIMRGEDIYWKEEIKDNVIMFKNHSAFWLGCAYEPHSDNRMADASYNEVRIWNRALTESEIKRSAKLGPDRLP